MLMTTSADRDWSDLPVKTVYLPLIQSLTQYLAGGKRGNLDAGIAVGASKELSFPANFVGRNSARDQTRQAKRRSRHRRGQRARHGDRGRERQGRHLPAIADPPAAIKTAARRSSTPSMRRFWNRASTRSAPPNSPVN